MRVRLPLVGQPNQRNLDSLQALIEGKDQRYQNGIIVPIHNPIAQSVKHYFEKRPGLEQGCLAEFGSIGTNIFYSRSTGKTIAIFDGDNVYIDCTLINSFDVPPVDRGDGRFIAVTDSRIGGVAGKSVMYSTDQGQTWNTVTLTGNLAADIAWQDVEWGGDVFMATSLGNIFGTEDGKGMRSTDKNGTSWEQITMPTLSGATAQWGRIVYNPDKDEWLALHTAGVWYIARSLDNGDNWTVTARLDDGSTSMSCKGIAYSADHDTYVAIGSNISQAKGLRYSTDDLATMTVCSRVGGGSLPQVIWRDIIYDPRTQLFIAGSPSGIWAYSSDGGQSFAMVTTDTDGNSPNIFSLIHTPTGVFAATSQDGTHGRDFFYSTDGISISRIDLNVGSGVFSRVAYNGAVIGAAGYGTDTLFKNFAVANDLPDGPEDFTEYINVVPTANVNGLAAQWSWWL